MNNFTYQRTGIKKHKKSKKAPETRIEREYVEQFLQGEREEALENIAYSLNNFRMNEIKPMLKQSIYGLVKSENPDFEGNIHVKECAYRMLSTFDAKKFIARKWKFHPYFLRNQDYQVLQTCTKYPIIIKNHDGRLIYNMFLDEQRRKGENRYSEEKIKNDLNFYISENNDIVFAKVLSLKYKPINLQLIKRDYRAIEETCMSPEEIESGIADLVEDPYLYSRSLSISMFVLLEGNPDKAMSFLRFDDEEAEHENVFIGDDKRKTVFGDKAKGPHFHFQGETDSLLCLKRYGTEDGGKYKTGRCNAIDIPHLKKYLKFLDSLDEREVEKQLEDNLHYGMPFLSLKTQRQALQSDLATHICIFFDETPDHDCPQVAYLAQWYEDAKNNKEYKNSDGRKFGKLIMALDFMQYINEKRCATGNLHEKKLLTNLEYKCAWSIINSISSCKTNVNEKDKGHCPMFEIDGTHICCAQPEYENE